MSLIKKLFLYCCLTATFNSAFAEENKVPYPKNYKTWFHVKTMLIEPGHTLANPFQGIHHVYANYKAVNGIHSGEFKDGSILVFDLMEYARNDHAIQEGDRKFIGVMVKNKQNYATTGGWGFEVFEGDSSTKRLVDDGGASCFACHTSQQKSNYVFSEIRK